MKNMQHYLQHTDVLVPAGDRELQASPHEIMVNEKHNEQKGVPVGNNR